MCSLKCVAIDKSGKCSAEAEYIYCGMSLCAEHFAGKLKLVGEPTKTPVEADNV